MALGKTNNNDGSKLYVLRPVNKDAKTKEKVEPHFEVAENVEGKWKVTRKEGKVSGNLTKVEIKEEEYQNIKYKKILLTLKDDSNKDLVERYLIDLRFNLTSRNLFNMLATLTNYDNLSISYYEGKNGYDRFSLRQGDTLVPWKYEIKDLPKPIEVTFKGAIQRDYSPIDDLFEKELKTIATKLGTAVDSSAPISASTPVVAGESVPF